MDLLNDSGTLLRVAGYTVSAESRTVFYFEDSSVYGFVSVLPTVEEIVRSWQNEQDGFLASHSESLRGTPEKAWNAYSVFLTEARSSAETAAMLVAVEENFRASRKIARADLQTIEDVVRALSPLLPIRNLVTLSSEDLLRRLRAALSFLDDKEAAAVLDPATTASQLAEVFLGIK
jgi:hypothetical protein